MQAKSDLVGSTTGVMRCRILVGGLHRFELVVPIRLEANQWRNCTLLTTQGPRHLWMPSTHEPHAFLLHPVGYVSSPGQIRQLIWTCREKMLRWPRFIANAVRWNLKAAKYWYLIQNSKPRCIWLSSLLLIFQVTFYVTSCDYVNVVWISANARYGYTALPCGSAHSSVILCCSFTCRVVCGWIETQPEWPLRFWSQLLKFSAILHADCKKSIPSKRLHSPLLAPPPGALPPLLPKKMRPPGGETCN